MLSVMGVKSTTSHMLPIYETLFNMIFDSGIIPESWALGEILPIYKNKGDKSLPENYRPITLLSCFGKLFTSIINRRLTDYVEKYEIINSCQAGFRKGYSIIDNLFVIQSLIDIMKATKNTLFCAFVDFKQAFDTVWRGGLWTKLLELNINGKCFNLIRNMYSNIKSRISTEEGCSAFFPCNSGVRQGENLSPLLFSIFVNDLEHYLLRHNVEGITCEANFAEIYIYLRIFILLYADDTVLFGKNEQDLQFCLDEFERYCTNWKLTVNTEKTKNMVFSGQDLEEYQFYLRGKHLEVVEEYKYLGIFLSKNASYTNCKKHIAEQANKAMFGLFRKIRELNLPIEIQIELFDKTIKPILLYACELWGMGNLDIIEKVQLKFLKQILHLKTSTPTFMIYGELGIFPLSIEIKSRILAFWSKLVKGMENHKLSSIVYEVLNTLRRQGKIKVIWIENVKHILETNGYRNVWMAPNDFNANWIVQSLKQRLKDSYLQSWNARVEQCSSGVNYRLFKDSFKRNDYFTFLSNRQCRILTRFRTRNHRLPVEVGRWIKNSKTISRCERCNSEIGDEYHYVMECSYFEDERKKYIKPYYRRRTNTLKYNNL